MLIETIEEWSAYSELLAKMGYKLWQWQYRAEGPEGFHARFFVSGKPDVEIITHSEEVENAIVSYRANR